MLLLHALILFNFHWLVLNFRMVLSVLATLITEHIMKVQSSEYRARSLKVLLDKAQKLRRAAGVATKLCLSALSDGHTIDVFWVRSLIRFFNRRNFDQ